MLPPRLSIVTLGASDIDSLREFYLRLGWERARPDAAGFTLLALDGCLLGLWDVASLAADAGVDVPAEGGGFRGVTAAIAVATAAEVDPALAAAQEAGATITKPAHDTPWRGRSGYFADPEGHAWEVVYVPGMLPN